MDKDKTVYVEPEEYFTKEAMEIWKKVWAEEGDDCEDDQRDNWKEEKH